MGTISPDAVMDLLVSAGSSDMITVPNIQNHDTPRMAQSTIGSLAALRILAAVSLAIVQRVGILGRSMLAGLMNHAATHPVTATPTKVQATSTSPWFCSTRRPPVIVESRMARYVPPST